MLQFTKRYLAFRWLLLESWGGFEEVEQFDTLPEAIDYLTKNYCDYRAVMDRETGTVGEIEEWLEV